MYLCGGLPFRFPRSVSDQYIRVPFDEMDVSESKELTLYSLQLISERSRCVGTDSYENH